MKTNGHTPSNERLAVIILGAGLGKRMGSDLPKVVHTICGMPLINHVLRTALALKPEKAVVVVGHKRELVEEAIASKWAASDHVIEIAVQTEQRGTGDAVKAALPALKDFTGTVLILYGDTPLLTVKTLDNMAREHVKQHATITVLTAEVPPPHAYGRIIRDKTTNAVARITEAKDCSAEELAISEINTGIYTVDSAFLPAAIDGLKNDNAQKEFYLPDIVSQATREGQTVCALTLTDFSEAQGVNDAYELLSAEQSARTKKIKELILSGVKVLDPATIYVDEGVAIEAGVFIGPQVQLRGKTIIKKGAQIEGSAVLIDTVVEEHAVVKFGVRSEGARIGKKASVGPFANLRAGTVLGEDTKIGNFVETKKAVLAKGAKASHLTYLGDCTLGEETNIGAGTITCNYDGVNKHQTTIGKGVFIGSNTALVAPVTINDNATVGAGSVITKEVEAGSLAFTRAPQVSKPGWSKRKKKP